MELAPFDDNPGKLILTVEEVRMCALDGDFVHANIYKPECQVYFLMKICYNEPKKAKFAGSTTTRIITDGETWAPVMALNASFALEDGFKVLNIRQEKDLGRWDVSAYRLGQSAKMLIRAILGYQLSDDRPYYWSMEWNDKSCEVKGIGPGPCLEFTLQQSRC